jgi:signal transduction histidine kinase
MAVDEDVVNVTIADTGRDIDPGVMPQIFELFTRGAPDVRGTSASGSR